MDITIDGFAVESSDLLCTIQEYCRHQDDDESPAALGLFAVNMDRTIASSLVILIRSQRWQRIGICRCSGRHADLVVISAMYQADMVQVTDCQFPSQYLSTLGMELQYTKTKKLTIVEMILTEGNCRALGVGLSRNATLESLDLRNTVIHSVHPLAIGLGDARHLRVLNLRFCKLRDSQLEVLLGALNGHSSLEELYLRGNFCRTEGMHQIANMLLHPNCNLRTLDLSRQQHSESAFPMLLLATALRTNQSLRFLDAMSNSLNDKDIGILADALFQNSGLEHLIVTGANPFSVEGANKLLQVMEHNFSIQRLRIPCHRSKEEKYQRRITFQANLNRGGRRILFQQKAPIPSALWSLVLERINKIEWGERGTRWSRPNMVASKNGEQERASVMYAILKDSPVLFEQ
jgi:hypothetical protein